MNSRARSHPLAWLLINVDVCVALEGISAILDVGHGKWNVGTSGFGEVDLLDARVVLGVEDGTPGADVFRRRTSILARIEHAFPTTRALRAEDVIELRHGKFTEWIVLIDHDLDCPKGAARLVPTCGDDEFGGQILLDLVERKQITDLCVISGRSDVYAEDVETRNRTLAGLSEIIAKRSVGV